MNESTTPVETAEASKPAPAKKSMKKTAPKKNVTPVKPVDHEKTKEIRWTPAKQSLLKTLVRIGATSATTAKLPEEVAKASKGGEKMELPEVKHQINPNWDITLQGYISTVVLEGERARRVFVTKKGVKKAESFGK